MNKAELINEAAKLTGLTTGDMGKVVDVVFDLITHAMKSGHEVYIEDFGRFACSAASS